MTTNEIFTVKKSSGSNTFELFEADGITPTNITSFTPAGNVVHGLVVCSNVNSLFWRNNYRWYFGCYRYNSIRRSRFKRC